jgi:hypothetical protein
MKRIIVIGMVCILLGGALALSQRTSTPDEVGRETAAKLFRSLSEPQKKQAARDWSDKERGVIRFATEATGAPISFMTKEQKEMVDQLFRSLLSDFGLKRCLEMGGMGRVTFYGKPGDGERFAVRIDKNNHLTLVYTEFGREKGGDFGPIALGAKGAGEATIWVEEDKLALELAAALTPEDDQRIKKGLPIGALSDKACLQARKLLEQRLAIFAPPGRKTLDDSIRHDGGVDKLNIYLAGDASKSIDAGGTYHWAISSPSFRCDWQFHGKHHPHMTLKAKRQN